MENYTRTLEWCEAFFCELEFQPPVVEDIERASLLEDVSLLCTLATDESYLGRAGLSRAKLQKLLRILMWLRETRLYHDKVSVATICKHIEDTALFRAATHDEPNHQRRTPRARLTTTNSQPGKKPIVIDLNNARRTTRQSKRLPGDAVLPDTCLASSASSAAPGVAVSVASASEPAADDGCTIDNSPYHCVEAIDAGDSSASFCVSSHGASGSSLQRSSLTESQKRKKDGTKSTTCKVARPRPEKWQQWNTGKPPEFVILLTHTLLDPSGCEKALINKLSIILKDNAPFETRIRDKHLLLLTRSDEDREKLSSTLKAIDPLFDLKHPEKRFPRVRLCAINPLFTVSRDAIADRNNWQTVIEEVEKQNGLPLGAMEFLTAFRTDRGYDVITQVTPRLRDVLENLNGLLYYNMKRIQVYDEFSLKLCMNCQSFGHVKQQCHLQSRCKYCAAFHESEKCSHKVNPGLLRCASCDESHQNFSWACDRYRGMLSNEIAKIAYNYRTIMRKFD